MILRNDSSTLDKIYIFRIRGQSNSAGYAQVTRLQNTQFNYKGIAAGYPTARSSQSQYVTTPANIFIYNKGKDITGNLGADNGVWEAYQAGVNSMTDVGSSSIRTEFGLELSLSQQLADYSGCEIFIVKSAFSGTSLTAGTTTSSPGNWNYLLRLISDEYYLKRAVRDLKTFRPGKRIIFLGDIWWQGETDANNLVSTATYEAEFATLYSQSKRYINYLFAIDGGAHHMYLVKPDFYRNQAEDDINTALTNIASTYQNTYTIDVTAYPQKLELTTAEASPLTKGDPSGNPQNADGGYDNRHQSYIAQLAAGELIAERIIQNGFL